MLFVIFRFLAAAAATLADAPLLLAVAPAITFFLCDRFTGTAFADDAAIANFRASAVTPFSLCTVTCGFPNGGSGGSGRPAAFMPSRQWTYLSRPHLGRISVTAGE